MDYSALSGQRIGVLGGTFDPVHNGHLTVADRVRKIFELHSVLFIPAAEPPHKQGIRLAPFTDRLAMLRLAVSGRPFFQVSSIEADRPGPSYSIDTLTHLRLTQPAGSELFFIIGSDAFSEITSWKNYAALPEVSHFIVLARSKTDQIDIDRLIRIAFPEHKFDKTVDFSSKSGCSGRIYAFRMEPISVSSTVIRNRVRKGKSIADLVPSLVAEYIEIHNLYKGYPV